MARNNKYSQDKKMAEQLQEKSHTCLKQAYAIAQAIFPKNSAHVMRIKFKLARMRNKK